MLTEIAFVELMVCWILWVLAFVVRHARPTGRVAVVIAPAARWGMLLQGLGYALAWSFPGIAGSYETIVRGFQPAWVGSWPTFFPAVSMALGPAAVALALYAVRHLGKQWRIQAGLNADHELVTTGPYRAIRHPIYASMLLMLLATGFAWSWWPVLPPAVALFLVGTEIRVRAEDRLLAGRFGDAFAAYRSHVRAYMPFVR